MFTETKEVESSNTMSDMDREWKPKVRPQSTMAQAFSTALDSAFMLDSDVDNLSQTISQKKQQMLIQTRELEELQNRIREAERRLQSQSTWSDHASSQTSQGQDQSAASQEGSNNEQQPEQSEPSEQFEESEQSEQRRNN
ncbi:hypothetical protein DTO013E5_9474 [Penicillium roqueforti]|uniref:Uncharacterized protein n=1 Tax=Penicillium roqueforti (strain FM164) TaxID=1365484 RepID=W6QK14_PENRF|nr:uncharacterized protein LCP9604111_9590 [Penicillium roqueforti]CDM37163.1 unnamed protein product [Penicillium roqueforti FM164]KAF9238016.1 hypothetical protein LCP9604111_9590 [Penicillium roqueforti]KAI1833437.1 hypothetical protein CBS147337_5935 [Penicillium roqueforti]KAI2671667.1 hypothetical protein LCP963914a_9596 [Penicillium roqueforti]KAI2671771.1 hypothetical protein CBS147355_8414 [Penicillium roqueforti]